MALSQTLQIALQELVRVFGTRRGWFSLLALLLVWALVVRYGMMPAAQFLGSEETAGLAGVLLQQLGANVLALWPTGELALYWLLAPFLLPFFCIVMAADQIASDRVRGTLRYLVLRVSRWNVVLGRFIGQCLLQLLLVVVTLGSVVALTAWWSPQQLPETLAVVPTVVLHVFAVLVPYVALMSMASVLAKSARQATLIAVVLWAVLSMVLGYVQSRFGPIDLLDWVLPGSQISALRTASATDAFRLLPIPLLHALVLLVLSLGFMTRRDL